VSDCVKFRELLEAYALGALDAPERAALEAHLATGCHDCAKALAEARRLVSQLAYLAPEAAPSDMLKGRLLQTVRAEAQAAKQSAAPKSAIPFWMWAGVAALFVIAIYSTWNAQRLQRDIQDTNQRAAAILQQRRDLEAQLEAAKRAATIVTDPASVKIPLASTDPQTPPLEATWHSQLGIVLTGQKTPVPSGNHVLQLWLIPKAPGGKQKLWRSPKNPKAAARSPPPHPAGSAASASAVARSSPHGLRNGTFAIPILRSLSPRHKRNRNLQRSPSFLT
jgi:hypothetical protein